MGYTIGERRDPFLCTVRMPSSLGFNCEVQNLVFVLPIQSYKVVRCQEAANWASRESRCFFITPYSRSMHDGIHETTCKEGVSWFIRSINSAKCDHVVVECGPKDASMDRSDCASGYKNPSSQIYDLRQVSS